MSAEVKAYPPLSSTIHIQNFRLYGYHGVLPLERKVGTWFYITLDIQFICEASAYANDLLEGTISYADIVQSVEKEFNIPSNLLEHVAHRIAMHLMQEFPSITDISIAITKEKPPMKADCEKVEVKFDFSRE